MPKHVIEKKPFPNIDYYHTPTGSVLHTESTTYLDSEEGLSSSGRFDREGSSFFYSPEHLANSRENSNISQAMNPRETYQSAHDAYGYSSNMQYLSTQPVGQLKAHAPMHTHTKSYDVASIAPQYGAAPYICPPPYDSMTPGTINYYPQPYMEMSEYHWEDQMGYMDPYYAQPAMQAPYPGGPGPDPSIALGKKGMRKRNPETEADKAKFALNLEDILNKKDNRTTIMIRNIPNKYNQRMLLKKIDENNKRQYDFFYLPIDFKVTTNSV